jgi:hypothetical protein
MRGNAGVDKLSRHPQFDFRTPVQGDVLAGIFGLARDEIRMNHHRALDSCLRMIFSENRCTLFRIMR